MPWCWRWVGSFGIQGTPGTESPCPGPHYASESFASRLLVPNREIGVTSSAPVGTWALSPGTYPADPYSTSYSPASWHSPSPNWWAHWSSLFYCYNILFDNIHNLKLIIIPSTNEPT